MKKSRKEELLSSFPAVPGEFMEQMQGRGAANFVVLLTRYEGSELFARCFHRYANGIIAERQRYVFAKDGRCRYGVDYRQKWTVRSEFREPVFCMAGYGYTFDNSYTLLNASAVSHSCMKYAPFNKHSSLMFIEFMGLYCKHPNVEYLIKAGYDSLIHEEYDGFYGTRMTLSVLARINWKSNNLLKMLGLNRTEFKALRGQETLYERYIMFRDAYPKLKPEELLSAARLFRYERGTAERLCLATGLKFARIIRYLDEHGVSGRDYADYIDQCQQLRYDLSDTAVSLPHDFVAIHTRLSSIIKHGNSEEITRVFRENMEVRKALEYAENSLFVRQPQTFDEIIAEGDALCHCVGGYAKRHALGKLHIMFIRSQSEPEKPLYTMEVDTCGNIVQVRGMRNSAPDDEGKAFVERYRTYLAEVFAKTRRDPAERKTA